MTKLIESQDHYIDHEARISLLEELNKRVEIRFNSIDEKFDKMDIKMDSQFKWIIGTIVTMIGGLIISKMF